MPEGTHSLAPRPGSLVPFAFQAARGCWSGGVLGGREQQSHCGSPSIQTIHYSNTPFGGIGPRGRICTCTFEGLSFVPLRWAPRGWLAEPKLRAKVGAHGRICTDTLRVLSAPSLRWTTWASQNWGDGLLEWWVDGEKTT